MIKKELIINPNYSMEILKDLKTQSSQSTYTKSAKNFFLQ